ncbi:hypothetical protein [Rubripirellula amarantea]|uniref:hypothetical protein n=1 Tax=Rubripirellula amarantea TaxID=2527999 RepID=UPI0011B6C8E2|nr:hypothetical protein [Rubripirellula amarantea]
MAFLIGNGVATAADENASKLHLSSVIPANMMVDSGSPMPWICEVDPIPEFASEELTLRFSVIRVSHGHQVISGRRNVVLDVQGKSSSISLNDHAPTVPGVYEVRMELVHSQGKVWSRFRDAGVPIATLTQPMIILPTNDSATIATETNAISQSVRNATNAIRSPFQSSGSRSYQSSDWETIGVLRPSAASWAIGEWIPESATRLIPGVQKATGELKTMEHHGEKVSLLDSKSVFQAKLPVMTPGMPHRIHIRVPGNQHQQLRVDIGPGGDQANSIASAVIQGISPRKWLNSHQKEPETTPRSIMPRLPAVTRLPGVTGIMNRSTETMVADALQDTAKQPWTIHTLIYYPLGKDQIWLTNLSEDDVAAFESIEVVAGPESLNLDSSSSAHEIVASEYAGETFGGNVVMHLRDRDWVENLTRDWKPNQDALQCDDQTIAVHRTWMAVDRLCQLAKLQGANAVAIAGESKATLANQSKETLLKLFKQRSTPVFLRFDIGTVPGTVTSTTANAVSATSTANSDRVDEVSRQLRYWSLVESNEPVIAGIILSGEATLRSFAPLASTLQSHPWYLEVPHQSATVELKSDVHRRGGRLLVTFPDDPIDTVHDSVALLSKDPAPVAVHAANVSASGNSVIVDGLSGDRLLTLVQQLSPTDLFVDADPDYLFVDQHLKDVCDNFRLMAHGTTQLIEPSDPSERTARLRATIDGDHVLLKLANLAPWDSRLILVGAASSHEAWQLWKSSDDLPVASSESTVNAGPNEWLVPARRSIILRAKIVDPQKIHQDLKSYRWSASINGGEDEIAVIKQKVTTVVERIGMLGNPPTYSGLHNGGFEVTGEMGLVGWMHAQHPPGCVSIDTVEHAMGKQSIRLTTEASTLATRTWMVSETILPPRTGRLAVSIACRAEAITPHDRIAGEEAASDKTSDDHPQLRVAIEGTKNGVPFRQSVDIEVPPTGVWQPRLIVLEALQLNNQQIDSLRLTIDSLSTGKIWIDDVALHDYFPTAKERSDLQNQAFLAVQGLQRGRLAPSAKLLHNHWAKVLLSNQPPAKVSPSTQSADLKRRNAIEVTPLNGELQNAGESEKVVEENGSETPSVADRFRDWLPGPLRF